MPSFFVLQNILVSLRRLEGSEHLVSRRRESFIAVKVVEGSADILNSRPAVVAELTVFRQDRSCVGVVVEGVAFYFSPPVIRTAAAISSSPVAVWWSFM